MSKIIVSPHDRMFRTAMSNVKVARDYFLQNLPKKILEVTDLSSLQHCPQTYVDEELKLSQSDVLYKVEIAGQTGYFYLLCEHQSTPDILMPYRVIKYEVNIWSDHIKQNGGHALPLIVTTVFYNGREPYTYSTDFRDLLNAPKDLIEEIWRKPFKLVDAHNITDEEIRNHKWFGILAFFMGHVYAREFLPYLKQSMQVLKDIEAEKGTDYVVTLLNYVLIAGETGSIEGFVDTVKEGLSTNTGEKIMTIAEQLMERGKQQGMQQGALLGERTLLKRMLAKRFGSVPSSYLEKVENADADSLLEISDKIVEATNLDDVFKNYH